ncbi:NUDIX hydrolase domain-like protein [Fusarium flagelliforme]|uniref:Nudix domain-containing protein n=1 Tax=Fusarium flagelliforme TaxID=2675880 RepID=A0A395M5P1_9HYPO|nr:NUDIX hydrolase domain-like protein [Fusarium flagelliforme]KAH7188286.1 NUDIX hydrolase domain-like protein [Fusarium flagelliforme]RFN43200.1 nudix domain-containing protein [Fusarium flagelliforme]
MASMERSLFFSDQFVISCGTVTIDVQKLKVLLIRMRKNGEYMLPKGRKDVGESLEATALRETYEETGVKAQLLPVAINSLATSPQGQDRPKAITEPIAVSQRMTKGGLKIIFWYIGMADSTIPPVEGTQQDNEDFETYWLDFDDFDIISFEDDRRVAQTAIAVIQRGEYTAC